MDIWIRPDQTIIYSLTFIMPEQNGKSMTAYTTSTTVQTQVFVS